MLSLHNRIQPRERNNYNEKSHRSKQLWKVRIYSQSFGKVPVLIFYIQEEERSSICATRNMQSQNSSILTQIHLLSGSRWSGPRLPGHRRWKNTLLKTRNSERGWVQPRMR